MKLIIYRRKIFTFSGAGQLIVMQAKKLREENRSFILMCKRGWFQLWLKNRLPAKKAKLSGNQLVVAPKENTKIIDHEGHLKNADITFIHNVPSSIEDHTLKVIKSHHSHIFTPSLWAKNELTKLGVNKSRVSYIHPGYNQKQFNITQANRFKAKAKQRLDVSQYEKVIGFITSGAFEKRGLVTFLDICLKVNQHNPNIGFFVLGGKKIPDSLQQHPAVSLSQFRHQTSSSKPEYWLSALDLFVYPAKFEEFGMVVAEALAMGIPVITTRNVGAHEILPAAFNEYLNDHVDIDWFSNRIIQLINDDKRYQALVDATQQAIKYDERDYATRSLEAIDKYLSNH